MKEFILELIFEYTAYAWLLVALGFLLLELSTPGLFFFIAFAFGAACAAATALLNLSIISQIWVALINSTLCFIAIKSFFATHKTKNLDSKTNVDALIGQEAIVVESVSINQPGVIRVKRELWGAILKDGSMLQIGTVVKIIDIQIGRAHV